MSEKNGSSGSTLALMPTGATSSATAEGLQQPELVAVYPTLAVVQWRPPLLSQVSRGPCRWQYTVEWSCGCTAHTGQPNMLSTSDPWLLLPLRHPRDDLHVRVVAREEVATAKPPSHTTPTRVFSSHVTLSAEQLEASTWKDRVPWLHPTALSHPCLADALLLSMHATSALGAMPPQRRELLHLSVKGVHVLQDTPFSIISAVYNTVQAPFETALVQYFVACTIPARRDIEQLSPTQLLAGLESTGNTTAVLCGFGELARNAVEAAHTVLAAAVSGGRAHLCRRVLCMAYAAPPDVTHSAPLSSVPYAGHFLFYDLSTPSTTAGPTSGTSTSTATFFASPIMYSSRTLAERPVFVSGVCARLGLSASGGIGGFVQGTGPCLTGSVLPQVRPQATDPAAALSELVCLLPVVLPQRSHRLLDPVVESVELGVCEEDASVVVVVRGYNLHYSPSLCAVQAPHGVALRLEIVNAAPHILIGRGSLLACLCQAHLVDRAAAIARSLFDTVQFRLITVTTAVGSDTWAAPGDRGLPVPYAIARLACLGSMVSTPVPRPRRACRGSAWLVRPPAVLLSTMLALQPLQYVSAAALGSALRTTVGLCNLSSCAELARQYYSKAAGNPLLTFFSNVASKVGGPPANRAQRRAEIQPVTLEVPSAMESAYYMTSLGHGVKRTRRDMNNFRDRSRSWLQRIFATLVWLRDDGLYERKLLALLRTFAPTRAAPLASELSLDACEALPLVALEQRLYTRVVSHLKDAYATGVSRGSQGVITDTMSFDSFYGAVHAVIADSVPAARTANEQLAAEIVLEAAAAWSFCLLYEMRCDAALSHTVAVIGSSEGAAAVAKALHNVWADLYGTPGAEGAGSPPRLHVTCVAYEDVTVLTEVLAGNALNSIFVAGEPRDYEAGTVTSLLRSVEACAGTRRGRVHRSQLHCLLIRGDSALSQVAGPRHSLATSAARLASLDAMVVQDLTTLSACFAEQPRAVFLPPSVTALDGYLRERDADEAMTQQILNALRQVSKSELRQFLTADVTLTDA